MIGHRLVRRTATLTLACATLTAAGTGVASATTPAAGLVVVQAKAANDIQARLAALNRVIPRVAANQVITTRGTRFDRHAGPVPIELRDLWPRHGAHR